MAEQIVKLLDGSVDLALTKYTLEREHAKPDLAWPGLRPTRPSFSVAVSIGLLGR